MDELSHFIERQNWRGSVSDAESLAGPRLSVSRGGEEMRTMTLSAEQRWRQVGWLGFSGCVYDLGREPSGIEPAGWSKLWVLIDNDPPITDEPT
jgi:hypothetical protein